MAMENTFKHAENILRAFEIEPRPLDRMVDAYYRRNRNLGPKERQLISEIVFGVMRWRRRLDGVMELAGVKNPTHLQRIAAYISWKEGNLDFEAGPKKLPGGTAAYWSYPDFLYDRLIEYRGEEWAAKIASALNEEGQLVIRVNTLKINRDELQKRLLSEGVESLPTKTSAFGLIFTKRTNLNSLKSFKEGLFEVQDEASQLVGLLADPSPSEIVIDVCAGAGGKTLLMAMLMEGEGRVVASDIDVRKLKTLKERARNAGAKNITVVLPHRLKELYGNGADAVLIDAPCTGTGTLRRNPDLKWRLSEDNVENCVKVQRQILSDSATLVKKGGRLIYATCSILPDENENVAEWFEKKFSWKLVDDYFQTDPTREAMDGFFACVFKRT